MTKIANARRTYVQNGGGKELLKIYDRDEVNDLKGQVSNLNSQISSLNSQLNRSSNWYKIDYSLNSYYYANYAGSRTNYLFGQIRNNRIYFYGFLSNDQYTYIYCPSGYVFVSGSQEVNLNAMDWGDVRATFNYYGSYVILRFNNKYSSETNSTVFDNNISIGVMPV